MRYQRPEDQEQGEGVHALSTGLDLAYGVFEAATSFSEVFGRGELSAELREARFSMEMSKSCVTCDILKQGVHQY